MGLNFPMEVSDVMELRDVINHAVDYQNRNRDDDDDNGSFSHTLEIVMGSVELDAKHREKRLLQTLSLFRDLYHTHSISNRDKELSLRCLLDENRHASMRSRHYGIACFVGAAFSSIIYLALPIPGWPLQVFTLLLAYLTWDNFHSMSVLERDMKILTKELNAGLRDRVNDVNWQGLIEKMAPLLGYKKADKLDVFLMNNSADFSGDLKTIH